MKILIWLLAFLFIGLNELSARPLRCAAQFPQESRTFQIRDFSHLPGPETQEFKKLVYQIRLQFKANRAYALVDMREWLTKDLGEHWYQSMLEGNASQIYRNRLLVEIENMKNLEIPQWQTNGTNNLQSWFAMLVRAAFSSTAVGQDSFSNTRLLANSVDGMRIQDWHPDGGRATVALAMKSWGPEFLGATSSGTNLRQTPEGFALIFFGNDIEMEGLDHPLIHRTPLRVSERLLHIIRL